MSEKPRQAKNKTGKRRNKKNHTRKNTPPTTTVIKVPMKPVESSNDLVQPMTTQPIEPQAPITNQPVITETKTPSNNSIASEKSELVKMFLEMLTTIKLYHWNTRSYARHKATDELHQKLSELVDQFVEVMQGKMFSPNRIRTINEEIHAITPITKEKMVDKVLYYIEQLKNFDNMFSPKKDSDLLNIRDEMMAHLNQFLYLFSFDEI